MKARAPLLAALAAAGLVGIAPAIGCSDSAGGSPDAGPAATDGGPDAEVFTSGVELKVPVPEGKRVYAKLADPPSVVTPADPKTDKGWDIAFEGVDVYTNSGATANGQAWAFGPLDPIVFLADVAPAVPFQIDDKTGGAFLRWYFYEGAPNHALHSRYHVYGVQDGAKTYKVQILSYYGEVAGAPTSARYKIRVAEVTAGGAGPTQEYADLDGTAASATDLPSDCIDLGTGARASLAPSAARTSTAWHLCFRREYVSVNGEAGGPRGVTAVDFDIDKSATETLDQILQRTPDTEKARFDAIVAQSFVGQPLRGDRIVSAFANLWTERGVSPPAPRPVAWVVHGADGKDYLLAFPKFEGATDKTPGTVVMRIKPVNPAQ